MGDIENLSHSSSINYRPARIDDYDGVMAVWSASGGHFSPRGRESREAFIEQLRAFAGAYVVAVDGDRIVGVVLGTHDHRKGWINRLAVLPEYQRRGIAFNLIRRCESALHDAGIGIICALVEPFNKASWALFDKLGYRDDVTVHYFRKLFDPEA